MAVHASLGRRDISYRRNLNEVMTIAAIEPEVIGVKFMAVGHRLCWTVADIGVPWRKIVPDKRNNEHSAGHGKYCEICGQFIGPTGEKLAQYYFLLL